MLESASNTAILCFVYFPLWKEGRKIDTHIVGYKWKEAGREISTSQNLRNKSELWELLEIAIALLFSVTNEKKKLP